MTIQANTFLSVNFDHCYSEGFKALKMQQSIDNNPFQTGSKEAHYWQEGWWDAFYEIAPRFTEQSNYLAANDGWINKLSKYKWPLVGPILSASLVATSWVIFEAAA